MSCFVSKSVLRHHKDIEVVINEVESLTHYFKKDVLKQKELELEYCELIKKLKDLEHQKEEIVDKRN